MWNENFLWFSLSLNFFQLPVLVTHSEEHFGLYWLVSFYMLLSNVPLYTLSLETTESLACSVFLLAFSSEVVRRFFFLSGKGYVKQFALYNELSKFLLSFDRSEKLPGWGQPKLPNHRIVSSINNLSHKMLKCFVIPQKLIDAHTLNYENNVKIMEDFRERE